MKKPCIIANWKANPSTIQEAKKLLKSIEKEASIHKGYFYASVPDIYFSELKKINKKGILGVENIGYAEEGAHTGRATANMIASVGAQFALIGHSEVRKEGETKEIIAKKIENCVLHELEIVLCVGEKERDPHGAYLKIIEEDLLACLALFKIEASHLLSIAYEPLWAVNAKSPATEMECFEVIVFIRRVLASYLGMDYAKKVTIIYGGSVDEHNAKNFLTDGGADGLLIGRASLNAKTFTTLLSTIYDKKS